MKFRISGVGLWARGIDSWNQFLDRRGRGFAGVECAFAAPVPEAIPARERRRSPLPVRLAVEVAHQACEMAGMDKTSVASVFTSAMGDTGITDYLCRELTRPEKMISPTKFHNSVHNAPSGYWSISAANRSASSFAGDFRNGVPTALLEAATLCAAEQRPVLLVAYDIENAPPFTDICPVGESFAAALLIEHGAAGGDGWDMAVATARGFAEWPRPRNAYLRALAAANPAAYCLSLLDALAAGQPAELRWPLSRSSHIALRLRARTRIPDARPA